MSIRASAWAKGQTHHPDGTKLQAREKLVLMVLSDYHNDQLGYAWVGLTRLSAETLTCRRRLVDLLKSFEEHGNLIRRETDIPIAKGQTGKQRVTNRYFLLLERGESSAASALPPSAASAPPLVQPVHHGGATARALGSATATAPKQVLTGTTNGGSSLPSHDAQTASREGSKSKDIAFRVYGQIVLVEKPGHRRLWTRYEKESLVGSRAQEYAEFFIRKGFKARVISDDEYASLFDPPNDRKEKAS